MSMAIEPVRWLLATALLLAYALMCARIAQGHIRRHVTQPVSANGTSPWLIAFASQTGTAEELALQTANSLRLAGISVQVCSLSEVDAQRLGHAERALFIASTYGEGDAPDNAARFCDVVMRSALSLPQLHYAVLALGDSSYAHFCGFGRMLDGWLRQQGAQALFERIDVDRGEAAAIDVWRQQLTHLAGTSDAPDWDAPAFNDWTLVERRLLNPGSTGEPVYHLELEPRDTSLPSWESGDLAQVLMPSEPDRPREYSIASIPEDRRVHLLVRLHRRADGALGLASGWLAQASLGERVKMRVRAHRRFRLGDNAERPLILIGNGTGIAGLRGHLKSRAHQVAPNWLVFGERNAAIDFHYRNEIEHWQAAGTLARVDTAFSRDQEQRCYVQDRLREAGDVLREWVERGAAIYVCGSLKGMAEGVDAALADILGREALESLSLAGRYRRDVY
jgi:sulfite reductase (NADPH) flavoprotein alpha-component